MFLLISDPLLRDYWVYEGSLTIPPCSEGVTWILFRYPLTVSQVQVTAVLKVTLEYGYELKVIACKYIYQGIIFVLHEDPIRSVHGFSSKG